MNLPFENVCLSEGHQAMLERQAYANKVTDPENKERLNNWRMFNKELWSGSPHMDNLVGLVAGVLQTKGKKRLIHLRVILANLVKAYGNDPTQYTGYYRKYNRYKSGRYNPAKVTRLTVSVVDSLLEAELIEHHRGRYNVEHGMGYVSKIRPTDDLIKLIVEVGVEPVMIGRHPNSEVVLLKDCKDTKYVGNGKTTKIGGKLIEYYDTPDIEVIRAEITAYNDLLQAHDIRVSGLPKPELSGVYRVFNDHSFELGGRYCGGWWINLSGDVRKGILIDNKPTIELDYSCFFLILLYALEGFKTIPSDDLYELSGFDRNIVKKVSMRCINNKGRHNAVSGLERDLKAEYSETGHLINTSGLVDEFTKKHSAVAHRFFKGMALELMYYESEICAYILNKLTEAGICCLPIYDSYIVLAPHKEKLWSLMVDAFKSVMGTTLNPVIKS